MAIKTYLYSPSSLTASEIEPYLLLGAAPVVGNAVGSSLLPITIDDSHKEDLDDAMEQLGYVFVAEYTGSAFTSRFDYGTFATDPTGISFNAGDRYYNSTLQMEMAYDAFRSKWLSAESQGFDFGRDGNAGAGQFYRGADGRIMSASIGWYAFRAGTVVSLAYTRSNAAATSFEITRNGTTIWTTASGAAAGRDVAVNADFSFGDILGVRNAAGGAVASDVIGSIRVRWRV